MRCISVFRQLQLKIMDQKQKFKRSGNGLRKFCLKTGMGVGDIEIYNWILYNKY
jgi:purine-nucleoside phosphorylase